MATQSCNCGHQKRDHNIGKSNTYGSCKICLCNSYQAVEATVSASRPPATWSKSRRTQYSIEEVLPFFHVTKKRCQT